MSSVTAANTNSSRERQHVRKQREPLQKATVEDLAQRELEKTTETIERGILDKIQKCLNRATHKSSTESEAKAALFVAQKMTAQHNVTQADLLASSDTESKGQYGGSSIVSIKNRKDPSRRVRNETFVRKLASAMSENTVAAAVGFEMAHNKILDWGCAYTGGSPAFSYQIGVGDGLVAMANREKRRELEDAGRKELDIIAAREREEGLEHQRHIDRLRRDADIVSPEDETGGSEATSSSDDELHGDCEVKPDFDQDDELMIDVTRDVDDNIERVIKRRPRGDFDFDQVPDSSVKSESPSPSSPTLKHEHPLSSIWESQTQLTRFRATSKQVADDFLKEQNIKLRRGRRRRVKARDSDAYRQGWTDSANIDFRQRRLEHS